MKLIFVPKGKDDYCIVDEESKFVHQFPEGNAYNKLFENHISYKVLSYVEITRENTSIPGIDKTDEITIDYKKWFNENINNIDEPEKTVIPF